jgi:hypothetical protein
LIAVLPDRVADLGRRAVPSGFVNAALWGDSGHLVQLQCGVARPSELNEVSTLLDVDQVTWFAVPEGQLTRYWAVDRRPYVEVVIRAGVRPDEVLVPLGKAVATLPKSAVDLHPSP